MIEEQIIELADELTNDFDRLQLFIKSYITYLYHNGFIGDAEAFEALDRIDSGESPTDTLKELMEFVEDET